MCRIHEEMLEICHSCPMSSISGDTSLNENSDTPLGDESGGDTFLDYDEENTELEPESNK